MTSLADNKRVAVRVVTRSGLSPARKTNSTGTSTKRPIQEKSQLNLGAVGRSERPVQEVN